MPRFPLLVATHRSLRDTPFPALHSWVCLRACWSRHAPYGGLASVTLLIHGPKLSHRLLEDSEVPGAASRFPSENSEWLQHSHKGPRSKLWAPGSHRLSPFIHTDQVELPCLPVKHLTPPVLWGSRFTLSSTKPAVLTLEHVRLSCWESLFKHGAGGAPHSL